MFLSFNLKQVETNKSRCYAYLLGIKEFNNLNFHQLAGKGPNFKNNHWRSQLLTFCKTLDPR
ncbi:hypothetical protein Hanom_Chr00s202058g01838251 [Helianthus anomalus]